MPGRPADVNEIIAVIRHTGNSRYGFGLRAIVVVLWPADLRVQETLALTKGNDPEEIVTAMREPSPPMMSASAGLRL